MPLPAETLRAEWKAAVERHGIADTPTAIRMHRVCKWLGEGQALQEAGRADMAFVAFWIAFNALYAQWEEGGGEQNEMGRMKACVVRLLRLDGEEFLYGWIISCRRDIEAIYDDPFLSHYFWQKVMQTPPRLEVDWQAIAPTFSRGSEAQRLRQTGQLQRITEGFLGRAYVLRNQLVHGGATPGSKVNREQVDRMTPVMGRFIEASIQAVIHANDQFEDWGRLPYPPL